MAKYTDAEYEQYLKDEAWTKEETDHLFDLCQTYDLRFFVIHDRWDASRFPNTSKSRSIDELKDRYYKVTGVIQKVSLENSLLTRNRTPETMNSAENRL